MRDRKNETKRSITQDFFGLQQNLLEPSSRAEEKQQKLNLIYANFPWFSANAKSWNWRNKIANVWVDRRSAKTETANRKPDAEMPPLRERWCQRGGQELPSTRHLTRDDFPKGPSPTPWLRAPRLLLIRCLYSGFTRETSNSLGAFFSYF